MFKRLIAWFRHKYDRYMINKLLKKHPEIDFDGDVVWDGNKTYYINWIMNKFMEVK